MRNRLSGVVKFYDHWKKYGMITYGNNLTMFVHFSQMDEKLRGRGLFPGDRVEFEIGNSKRTKKKEAQEVVLKE